MYKRQEPSPIPYQPAADNPSVQTTTKGRKGKACHAANHPIPVSYTHLTDDYIFDVEKKDSIRTLLLTLWKSEDDKVTKTESGELGSAVSAYIERIQSDRSICLLYTSRCV